MKRRPKAKFRARISVARGAATIRAVEEPHLQPCHCRRCQDVREERKRR